MKLHDTLIGLLLALLGAVVAWQASAFPPAPGAGPGAGAFPLALGLGLAGCGVLLGLGGRIQAGSAWFEPEAGLRRWRTARNALLVPGALLAYALVVETAGFFLTSFVLLAVLFLAFGVRRRWIAPLAAGVTLALHGAFYSLLRVPLPWGWLEGIAW
jgi:putative tricarboxylic transport membrane protein